MQNPKKVVKYKEGDTWTEKGKTWTIKNGIKRTLSKFDSIRKKINTPLGCPKCGKSLSRPMDQKMYTFNNCCLDCTVKFEHELRIQGKYEEYEKARVLANAKGFVTDLEVYINEFIQDNNTQNLVTEDGDVEAWQGNAGSRFEEIAKPLVQKAKDDLTNVENERGI